MSRIEKDFFERSADTVARDLIGRKVRTGLDGGRGLEVVETGAYEGETRTTGEGFYHEPGNIYIHNLPGGYNTLAVSTESSEKPSVVAFRAGLEEEAGLGDFRTLLDGPGNFSEYLGVTKEYDGVCTDSDRLWIEGEPVEDDLVDFTSPEDENMAENCIGCYQLCFK